MATSTELLDLDFSQRQSWFRFDLYSKSNVKIGEVHPSTDTPITVENFINRSVKRQLSNVSLPPDEWPNINLLSDRIKPVMILENTQEWPLGEFLFADSTRQIAHKSRSPRKGPPQSTPHSAGDTVRTDASWMVCNALVDQCYLLDQPTERAWGFCPGILAIDALNWMLNATPVRGIHSTAIAVSSVVIGPGGIAWPAGTSFLKVLTDLCQLMSFSSPWFDSSGTMQIQRYPDTESPPSVVYGRDKGNIVADSLTSSSNLIDVPNRVICVSSNSTTNDPIVGVYDVPDDNPISYASRGFRVAKTINPQGVTDVAHAVQLAEDDANASLSVLDSVGFSSAPDPRHDTFQIIGFEGVNYREYSWTMTLTEGADMAHNAHRGGTSWATDDANAAVATGV